MKKRFNITGACSPSQHYMADVSRKFDYIVGMVEEGLYFTINRPRQYGKTTTMFRLMHALNQTSEYLALSISFEGVGNIFKEESTFGPAFLDLLKRETNYWKQPHLTELISKKRDSSATLQALSDTVGELVEHSERKIVVLIDEVDKSSNNQLFLHFLGMLRDKYLLRERYPTFHSVVLAGVHDVKSLKFKIRLNSDQKLNSPWNIAADFKVDMNLQPDEIRPMLEEYARDRGLQVEAQAVAERLFYYTSGHPFLVSKLCKMFDEEMLPKKVETVWTTDDVDQVARQLTLESNVNFDDLSKNLDNNPELYRLAQAVALNGERYMFTLHNAIANLGILYGIFTERNGLLAIHNRIYQEIITEKMMFQAQFDNQSLIKRYFDAFWLPGNHLDIRKVLFKFQEMMREEQNTKDQDFLEREGRLLFLAFLKPVLNGHGYALKEPQTSEEKRLDVFVSYHEHRYVVELKLWYGQKAHEKGLDQLADYLDHLGLEEGYLLIFDHRKTKEWIHKDLVWKGKKIWAVWT